MKWQKKKYFDLTEKRSHGSFTGKCQFIKIYRL